MAGLRASLQVLVQGLHNDQGEKPPSSSMEDKEVEREGKRSFILIQSLSHEVFW